MTPAHYAVLALWFVALVVLFFAATTDLRERRIPNVLVLAVLLLGIAIRIIEGKGTLGPALLIVAALFAAGAWLAARNIVGGGDVKMIAAVSSLLPPYAIPGLLLCIALTGGVLSGIYLGMYWLSCRLRRSELMQDLRWSDDNDPDYAAMGTHAGVGQEALPYGVAIFGGVVSFIMIGVFS